MDHLQILKRAWKILWNYRALWIFGVILALTSASSFGERGNVGPGGDNTWRRFNFPPSDEIGREIEKLNQLFTRGITAEIQQVLIWVAVLLVLLFLLLVVLFTIGRYVSQTALARMVDQYERNGEKVTWRQGFRLGWSRAAWRLFLINLVIFLPVILGIILLLSCAAMPVILGSLGGREPTLAGIIATIGMAFLIIFLAILVGVVLSLIMEIIQRVCVLENRGVLDSIRQGWQIVLKNLKDVILMWLILLGIKIGYFIALIPVALLVIGGGLLVGGGVGIALYIILRALSGIAAGWITAAIIGGTLFLVILSVPLLFLGGLRETYISSVWTLAYRELSLTAPRISNRPENNEAAPAP